jgi:hypothetical protein
MQSAVRQARPASRPAEEASLEPQEVPDPVFGGVCGCVLSGLAEMDRGLADLLVCKDALFDLKAIPTNVMLHIAVVVSSLYRASMEMRAPLMELIRLVRLHQQEWDRKSEALADILDEHQRARRELSIALTHLEQRAARDERMRALWIQSRWVRLYVKTNAAMRQGGRWKNLIGSFRTALMENTVLAGMASDPDDLSEDEEDAPMLACKPPRKGKSVRAMAAAPNAKATGIIALEEENARLLDKIKSLQERLEAATAPVATSNTAAQTDAQVSWGSAAGTSAATTTITTTTTTTGMATTSNATPHATLSALSGALSGDRGAEDVVVRVAYVEGFRGAVPGDLSCSLAVTSPASNGLPCDVATTKGSARIYGSRNGAVFMEDLTLHKYSPEDHVTVVLASGPGAHALALGTVPVTMLLQCANGSAEVAAQGSCRAVAAVHTTLEVQLTPTEAFADFCDDAEIPAARRPKQLTLTLVPGRDRTELICPTLPPAASATMSEASERTAPAEPTARSTNIEAPGRPTNAQDHGSGEERREGVFETPARRKQKCALHVCVCVCVCVYVRERE